MDEANAAHDSSCRSRERRRERRTSRGFASISSIVGAMIGLLAIASILVLARGVLALSHEVRRSTDDTLAARWAMDRILRAVARAGIGVDPDRDPVCPDEAVELATSHAIGLRGDRDGDLLGPATDPERWLIGLFRSVPTANDEVELFLRRNRSGRGRERAEFDADLHSVDQVVVPDGRLIARRDGTVERIDGGPAAISGESSGTLYRVTFTSDARRFGSGRFRVTQPLTDGVSAFRIEALDRTGALLPECGGTDDAAGRACRSAIRAIRVTLQHDGRRPLVRERLLPLVGPNGWREP